MLMAMGVGQSRISGFLVLFASTLALSPPAWAGEQLEYGPSADWVVEVAPGTPEEGGEELPIRSLLYDFQMKFRPGGSAAYNHSVFEIRDAQGLAAGNLSIIWSPEHEQPTVHKVLIRRGAETIDVLARGQKFAILRREQNLEQATLDGRLTASILPEGLQVGDIVEFATTIDSANPIYGDHVEALTGLNGSMEKAHIRFEWPASMALNVARTAELPELTRSKAGGLNAAELTLENIEPILPPRQAPLRYSVFRIVEATNFDSWAELARHFAPLYAEAAVLPAEGSLRDEVERIRQLSDDPAIRAEAALRLVQDQIRYVALQMGVGGLKPASAEDTWSRRFGDCKAKTALLLAILNEFGIEAEPVFVGTAGGDMIPDRLPAVGLFDHVLVRARIGGSEYWLDGTRLGDRKLANLAIPDFGWGLPLGAVDAQLVRMLPLPLEQPDDDMTIHFDASAGLSLPAPARLELVLRGDAAIETNAALVAMSASAREQALRQYWRNLFDFIDVSSAEMAFDADAALLRLTMTGEAEMEWDDGWYRTNRTGVGYDADFDRVDGPHSDAPYRVGYPYFERTHQTIVLPPGFTPASIHGDTEVDQVVAGIEYKRHATLTGNVFTIEKTERSLVPEISAAEAKAAERVLRRLADETVYLRWPSNYAMTEQETEALLDRPIDDPDELVARGIQLMRANRHADALVDFEDATMADPDNAAAWANLGYAHIWLRDYASAEEAFSKAEKLDPRNAFTISGRGFLAERQGRAEAAISAYTRALAIEPNNYWTLGHRAIMRWATGDAEAAFADVRRALELDQSWFDLYALKAEALKALGREDEALAEPEALMAANPGAPFALITASRIYNSLGQTDLAIATIETLAGNTPEAEAEATAAIEADPMMAEGIRQGRLMVLATTAGYQIDAKRFAAAVESFGEAIGLAPDDPALLTGRGIALDKLGRTAEAEADFAQARSLATGAMALNNICYMKARAGVALEMALEECDASLDKQRDFPPTLDSRALVYLQLGRLDDAIKDYDAALRWMPTAAPAFYGRAVAWARKGDLNKARADATAAYANAPGVEQNFRGTGVELPADLYETP